MNDNITTFPIAPRLPVLLFLNGPAGCGKSSLADYLISLDRGMMQYHHASPLWSMLDCIVNPDNDPENFFDFSDQSVKSSTVPWAGAFPERAPTFRSTLIDLGSFVRLHFGPDSLAQIATRVTRDLLLGCDTVIFPAIRTLDDIRPLVAAAGNANCLLLRIHRNGHTWEGDLGGYLWDAGVPSMDIYNDDTLEEFYSNALRTIGVPA